MGHKFDIDKHALDQELRNRLRVVIRGLIADNHTFSVVHRDKLEDTLTGLQPIKAGSNIARLHIGVNFHWDHKTHNSFPDGAGCVLVLLRQLIINFWDYLLEGSDESLTPDGWIENHLETLEDYVERGLDKFVVVGTVRGGFWLMDKGEYQKAMEDVR